MVKGLVVILLVYGGVCIACVPPIALLAWYELRTGRDPIEPIWLLPDDERHTPAGTDA